MIRLNYESSSASGRKQPPARKRVVTRGQPAPPRLAVATGLDQPPENARTAHRLKINKVVIPGQIIPLPLVAATDLDRVMVIAQVVRLKGTPQVVTPGLMRPLPLAAVMDLALNQPSHPVDSLLKQAHSQPSLVRMVPKFPRKDQENSLLPNQGMVANRNNAKAACTLIMVASQTTRLPVSPWEASN